MKIIHFTAECYPVAKVGGLGDVLGALPKYLNQAGEDTSVVMPCYETKFVLEKTWDEVYEGTVKLAQAFYTFKILKESTDVLGFPLYVVRIPGLIEGPAVYTGMFDTERFTGFQLAALQWIQSMETLPDVLHCHDHHSGLVPFLIQYAHGFEKLRNVAAVFTIHNGLYQGQFAWSKSNILPSYDSWKWGMLDWDGFINPMASAIKCSWKFSTVSQGYMEELRTEAAGLESLIRMEWAKAAGIVNGIDTDVWNPATDTNLEVTYAADDAEEGKRANKEALCKSFNLDASRPLISFIGRLVHEKGADLLAESIYKCIQDTEGKVNFLVLGSGASDIEEALKNLKHFAGSNFNCYIGYNEKLSHLIYAGSDFLLMPSRMEPCGLNQLYALKYGTVPMVRSTGGLKDTVTDLGEEGGFGLRFNFATVNDIGISVRRALMLWEDAEKLAAVRKHMMQIDHSWEHSAAKYIELYKSLKKHD